MRRLLSLLLGMLAATALRAQTGKGLWLKIVTNQQLPLPAATVELLKKDSALLKVAVSDSAGLVVFEGVTQPGYLLRISCVGYASFYRTVNSGATYTITLLPETGALQGVTITARKPFIELLPDKTIINLEAGITTVGTTVMEALEKLPGITIDKEGTISLKGRSGVLVMLDGKRTYLSAADLATLLNGMSASQISEIELMDNPPAKYDAAGNAGIINIKTKKAIQKGWNGSLTTSFAQGYYPKSNTNLNLNFRTGRLNLFLNYSANITRYFTRLYALRTYFGWDGTTIASLLEQPGFIKGSGTTHNLRTGLDYAFNDKTSVGVTVSGLSLNRTSNGDNGAQWMKANRTIDSVITTKTDNSTAWKNKGAALSFKHSFTALRELTADVDLIGYAIRSHQYFENTSLAAGGYTEASRAYLPTDIHIISARTDYTSQVKNVKLEGGGKFSNTRTDNLAAYEYKDGMIWKQDWGKTNRFLYNESIYALYGAAQTKLATWNLQGGLRYENTDYDAKQSGNASVSDSTFSRRYSDLFPSLFVSFEKDSSNTFSISTSRRIDRPAFQKLNPFLFIINKYTYQKGNPFYRPQYTWSAELSHSYKKILLTGISYSVTTDYFSQIFPPDTNGIIIYTEGNLSRLQNFGASVGLQLTPKPWWTVSLQGVVNYKKLEGIIGRKLSAGITQYNLNLANQFRFKSGWAGELSGFYNSASQQDIQEVLDPSGQVSFGVSKTVFQNGGIFKLAMRDVFYTAWLKGLTYFSNAIESFKLTRDTRVVTLSFTWRFGKLYKAAKHSEGAAGDEVQRVGSGQ